MACLLGISSWVLPSMKAEQTELGSERLFVVAELRSRFEEGSEQRGNLTSRLPFSLPSSTALDFHDVLRLGRVGRVNYALPPRDLKLDLSMHESRADRVGIREGLVLPEGVDGPPLHVLPDVVVAELRSRFE
ncbi:hypothetical protein QJS10_CPB15g01381 [Acorus calamus]|uniref:Uncharacterized protein n=1 Tax=Acorus calamus TaxID=4465 RepID=A0AAV9D8I7_ACOCL|nr:hypothetical protein QJS10_CPB15g01381 [Acorus calamus]